MSAESDQPDDQGRKLVFSFPYTSIPRLLYKTKIAHRFHLLAAGTLSGDGLQQILGRLGGNSAPAQSFYKAARIYNSGSVDPSGKLEKGVATHCYASDVANRLMGWASAPSNCHLDPQ